MPAISISDTAVNCLKHQLTSHDTYKFKHITDSKAHALIILFQLHHFITFDCRYILQMWRIKLSWLTHRYWLQPTQKDFMLFYWIGKFTMKTIKSLCEIYVRFKQKTFTFAAPNSKEGLKVQEGQWDLLVSLPTKQDTGS